MEGAAMSNLIAYGGYFVLVLLVVRCICGISVSDKKTLISTALIAMLFIINTLWVRYLPIENIWLSSIVRTIVMLGIGVWAAWALQLSPELNGLVRRFVHPKKQ